MTNAPIDFIETESIKKVVRENDQTTTIPLRRPTEVVSQKVDIDATSEEYWSSKSRKLSQQYQYGVALGKFGNNANTVSNFYKRLSTAIIETTKQQCNIENKSTEDLSCHFDVISNIMKILATEVERKNLTQMSTVDLLACLHGYIEAYIKKSLES